MLQRGPAGPAMEAIPYFRERDAIGQGFHVWRYRALADLAHTGEKHVARCLAQLRARDYSVAELETMARMAEINHTNLASVWMLPQAIWVGAFAAVVAGQAFLQNPWIFGLFLVLVISAFLSYIRSIDQGNADVVLQHAIALRLAEITHEALARG
ncbi:MAG TPA: hypothetical protein VKY74_22640 [Chloroflexia bacterium]|nr:hypothetical protein [Chloroflexia bacterium]